MCGFAKVTYSKSSKEIPIKIGLLGMSDSIREWYIKKFNPIKVNNICIEGVDGIEIVLPLIKNEKKEICDVVNSKTIQWLSDKDIQIVKWEEVDTGGIEKATGKTAMAIFIKQVVEKAVKIKEIEQQKAEVIIIDGDYDITCYIAEELSNEVNYITVLSERNKEEYNELCQKVFADTGLEIMIAYGHKELVKYGDIIINTSVKDYKTDYMYKRNCVYIDLSQNKERLWELIRKRNDMLIADGIRLKGEEILNGEELEMMLYVKSKAYRSMVREGYAQKYKDEMNSYINDKNIKFVALSQGKNLIKGKNGLTIRTC